MVNTVIAAKKKSKTCVLDNLDSQLILHDLPHLTLTELYSILRYFMNNANLFIFENCVPVALRTSPFIIEISRKLEGAAVHAV
jgi:hypothetical protein